MDFDESPEDAAFRAEVRAWLDEHAIPKGHPDDFSTRAFAGDDEWVKKCKQWQSTLVDHNWAGITWPAEYGGRGGTPAQAAIFNEEQSRYGVAVGLFTVGISMVGPTIIGHGTEEQKRRFLPPMLRGDEVWCQLFSEPGAGSDLAGLSTRAVRDGDEWVVNGQKVWTSGAHHSDFGILLTRTNVDVPKHRGITYFLVDMRTPGIEVRPLRQITGHSHFSEVFLTDVRIPHENVLGDVDAGWSVAMTTLASERTYMGGGSPGLGYSDLAVMARELGRAGDAVVRQGLAASYTRAELMRYLSMRVRTQTSQGKQPGTEASVMKLFAAWNAKRNGELALAIEGPLGMLHAGDAPRAGQWHQQFLQAPSLRIAGGSDQVQRNIIGERVLGLPGEPRVDKDVPFRDIGRTSSRTP